MIHRLIVPAEARLQRLDVWLTAQLAGCTRSLVARLIDQGRCMIDERAVSKAGVALRGGECIELEVPDIEPLSAVPEDIPLNILFEDDDIIVINKPPGMVVHPAIGHPRGTVVNAVLGHWQRASVTGDTRPGVVHRLDADTSGVMVVARHAAALVFLQEAWKSPLVRKRYVALIAGCPRADLMSVDAPIGRSSRDFRKRAVVAADALDARPAQTTILIHHRCDGYAIAECRPRTGRTHQIRVHCAHIGHPILADRVYGRSATWPPVSRDGEPAIRRQALHAWQLDIPHPSGKKMSFIAPIPADLAAWCGALEPKSW